LLFKMHYLSISQTIGMRKTEIRKRNKKRIANNKKSHEKAGS
jgi:hypothetical protein